MPEIPFSFPVIAIGSIIAQGGFAALLLFITPNNKSANRFLGLLLLAFSLWLIDSFYKTGRLYRQDPDFYFQPIFYSFAFGPLLFFYVKKLTNSAFRLKKHHIWHFLPVIIQGSLYWFLFFQDYPFRRWFWENIHNPVTYNLEFDLTLLSLLIYMLFSVRLLKNYRLFLENNYSEFSKIDLWWLRFLLLAIGGLCLIWGVDVFLREVMEIYRSHNFSEIMMGLLVLALAVGGLTQNSMVHVNFRVPKSTEPQYELDENLLQRIEKYMKKEKAFLNPTLTLQEFAKQLKEPSRRVSTHINHGLNSSFVDFVNKCRVDEVIKKIANNQHKEHTLLGIAMDSGFNSKSTFNRVFKKITGKSPKEYLQTSQNAN